MLITENCEQKQENDKTRMRIINKIMNIYNERSLKMVLGIAEAACNQELNNHPFNIIEIASLLDTVDIVRILDAMKDTDMMQIAARQIEEAFKGVIA